MTAGPDDFATPNETGASATDAVVVHLHAGQVFVSTQPCTISTILGSCVSVCLIDAERRTGGANHYLLPLRVVGNDASARFGSVAIEQLVAKMLVLGSRRRDLVAKVFGGASVLGANGGRPEAGSLGSQNVEVARQSLAAQQIPIVAEDVGGTRGRKLLFRTDEGHAWIRKL